MRALSFKEYIGSLIRISVYFSITFVYSYLVRLGEWDTSTAIDCVGTTCADPPVDILVVRTFTRLERNQKRTWVDNIGILRLARSVKFTKWISPICLPTAAYFYDDNNWNYVGATFISSGWNRLVFNMTPGVKFKVNVKVVEDEPCEAIWNRERRANRNYDTYNNFCTLRDSAVCRPGEPLMAIDSTNAAQPPYWYVVGLHVQGPNCGGYGMCEKVVTHIQWIKYVLSVGYGDYNENRLPKLNITDYDYNALKGNSKKV